MSDKPLVTISMMTYNQEKYVREAVRGLLSQTYEPLEIVISDDCSTDGTWDIIQEEIQQYRSACGPHVVVLNRNNENLGILLNSTKIDLMSHGILVVTCGGDDVSYPERVEKIVEMWEAARRNATVIFHDGIKIDLNGIMVGLIGRRDADSPLGACMAYSRSLLNEFGEIEEKDAFEDHVIARRAILIGEELHITDRLVKYRVGSGVSSVLYDRRIPELRSANGRLASYRQNLKDLEFSLAKGIIKKDRYERLKWKYLGCKATIEQFILLISADSFIKRWTAYKSLYLRTRKFGEAMRRCPYLFPARIGDAFYKVYDRFMRQFFAKVRLRHY